MNKIRYTFIILLLAACGNDKSAEVEKTPQQQAAALRDSAVKMAARNSDDASIERSLALLDEAIALDPESKRLYSAKMNIYTKSGDFEGVAKVLEKLDESHLKDPYHTLELGMEYDLQGKKDEAKKKYSESADAFLNILDTMKVDHRFLRNNLLLNVAVAASLSESASDKEKLDAIMTDAERENLNASIEQLYRFPREEILNRRRKK